MQRLIALLLDSDKNREIMDDTYNTYARAPRAYNRAIGVLLSMRERHPRCMSVSLARRKGPASSAGNPATLIVASRSGVFNDRGWEARIPVIEHEGEILIDDRDEHRYAARKLQQIGLCWLPVRISHEATRTSWCRSRCDSSHRQ